MKIPVVRGIIDRRILVNFRIDPDILSAVLPDPFRPKLVHGCGIAGICLIRLKRLRPQFVPGILGISSENAAHRIAVQWEHDGRSKEGVYIPRRDTSSRLNALAGGRLFPGVHHHARFVVEEDTERYSVVMDGDDRQTRVAVAGRVASQLPATSHFASLTEASNFFEEGSLGYSATREVGRFDGLELHTFNWHVAPLEVERVESSFFDNQQVFPKGSVEFDCALLMRGIQHEWRGREEVCSDCVGQPANKRTETA